MKENVVVIEGRKGWKKAVAREWLIFLGCVAAAVALWPRGSRGFPVEERFEAFFVAVPVLAVILYVALVLVRFTLWAIRTVRRRD